MSQALVLDASWMHPWGCIVPPGAHWKNYVPQLAWECIGIPPKSGFLCLDCFRHDPALDKEEEDGWMDIDNIFLFYFI